MIPKPGSSERRPLSIPAVRDQIVQAALKAVLEPIFEADFLECSFGFRRRRWHDALQVLIDETWGGRRWVVETDVASCLDAIPHDRLVAAVEERICDRKLLTLLRALLPAGVMERGRGQAQRVRYAAGWCCLAAFVQRLPAPAGPGLADARLRCAGACGVKKFGSGCRLR